MRNSSSEYKTNQLNGRKLVVARALWWSLTTLIVALFIIGIPVEYHSLLKDARNLYIIQLLELHISEVFYASFHTLLDIFLSGVFIGTGIIIYLNRPRDGYLMLMSMSSMCFGVLFTPTLVTLMGHQPLLTAPIGVIRALGLGLSVVAGFYLFPNGRFVPPVTRFLAALWGFLTIGWLLFPQMPANLVYVTTWTRDLPLAIALFSAIYLSGALSQVYRFKKVSGPVQRQQTKWVVLGTAVAIAGFVLYFLPLIAVPSLNDTNRSHLLYEFFAKPVYHLMVVMAPVSITVSILRFRLWDVDHLLNRSMVYGILTVVLGLVYLGVVFFMRSFLLGFTSYSSTITTIASTLAIAALFTPLRTAIQAMIDQRFFRTKYDASKTLEAFRKRMRNKVDIQQLTQEIIDLVDETIQPENVSIWLVPRTKQIQKAGKRQEVARNKYRNDLQAVDMENESV